MILLDVSLTECVVEVAVLVPAVKSVVSVQRCTLTACWANICCRRSCNQSARGDSLGYECGTVERVNESKVLGILLEPAHIGSLAAQLGWWMVEAPKCKRWQPATAEATAFASKAETIFEASTGCQREVRPGAVTARVSSCFC